MNRATDVLAQSISFPADLLVLANHRPAGLYHFFKSDSLARSESLVTALVFAFFVLGLSLARFGVLAALIATALSTFISFVYGLINDSTLTQAFLWSMVSALVLQVGYLVGQVVPPLRR